MKQNFGKESIEFLNQKQFYFYNSITTLSWNHCELVKAPFNSIEIDVSDRIPVSKLCKMSNEVSEFRSYNIPQSLLMQVIEEAELIHSPVSSM